MLMKEYKRRRKTTVLDQKSFDTTREKEGDEEEGQQARGEKNERRDFGRKGKESVWVLRQR